MIGRKLGDYEIVRLIGRGGMGAVYEALNPSISRRAAIKVLLPEYAEVDEVVRRFINEARAVNTINHPGVVQVSEVKRSPTDGLYLVMEYLDGQTLGERLESRGGKLPEAETTTVAWQLAGVLTASHAKSIVHRDLKPSNVMLVPDMAGPGGERVKLLDFGIAKLGAEQGEEVKTRRGQIIGTAAYMSPEQFSGDKPIEGPSDVYSLGAVMYRMLAGRTPFVSTNGEMALAAMHLFNVHRSLVEIAPETSPWLSELVDEMLRKDPAKRPTMAEVLAQLQAHLAHAPPPQQNSMVGALLGAGAVGDAEQREIMDQLWNAAIESERKSRMLSEQLQQLSGGKAGGEAGQSGESKKGGMTMLGVAKDPAQEPISKPGTITGTNGDAAPLPGWRTPQLSVLLGVGLAMVVAGAGGALLLRSATRHLTAATVPSPIAQPVVAQPTADLAAPAPQPAPAQDPTRPAEPAPSPEPKKLVSDRESTDHSPSKKSQGKRDGKTRGKSKSRPATDAE